MLLHTLSVCCPQLLESEEKALFHHATFCREELHVKDS